MDAKESSGAAPLFGMAPADAGLDDGNAKNINLDDIFADCFLGPAVDLFGPESAQAGAGGVAGASSGSSSAVPTAAGAGGVTFADWAGMPGRDPDADEEEGDEDDEDGAKKRKRPRAQMTHMTEQQKVERRERNREHAKRSRVRKKFLLESLQQSVGALQAENDKLRAAITEHMGSEADELLAACTEGTGSLIAANPNDATRILDDPDYSLVKALQTAQQNFVITDPSLPDNPIVFASQGFLTLTGYSLDQVLGRNCRFLQGPETDPRAVHKIRKAIQEGFDTSVCLLNYRIDGSTFWNQFFVAPLRDSDGNVVNYVGVQCKVSDDFARAIAQSEAAPSATDI